MISFLGATTIEWIVLVCNCFSTPLYLITIFLLIKHRKVEPFNSIFFKLYISAGISDFLINFSFTMFCVRIWGWIDWHPLFYYPNPTLRWWFRMMTYINWFNGVAQVNGVFMVAINRFWNIVYVHNGPWTSRTLKLVIFAQWVTALAIDSPFFFLDYTVVKVNGTGGEVLHSRPPMKFYSTYVLLVGGGYFSTVAIIVGALYFIMFLSIHRHNKGVNERSTSTTNGSRVNTSAEIRLAIMGFVLFILLALYCAAFAMYAYVTRAGNKEMMHLMNMLFFQLGIVQAQINPWLLIACSTPMREVFLELIGYQGNYAPIGTVVLIAMFIIVELIGNRVSPVKKSNTSGRKSQGTRKSVK